MSMNILIIDDEESIRKTMRLALTTAGHRVNEAGEESTALEVVRKERVDTAILDLKLGGADGLELLPKLLEADPELDVIVITAYGSIQTAVNAVKLGASEFLTKPVTPDQLRQTLKRIAKTRELSERVQSLEDRLSSETPGVDLTTEEPALRQVYEQATKAANSSATILLLGESGTGKSVLARAIHEQSPFKEREFVTVSCPSLSRELLESELFGHVKGSFTGALRDTWGKVAQADGGTLFLDEIGELPPEIQPKLLRLLQEREYERLGEHEVRKVNVRVIAATNRDLTEGVKEGRFREDLLYRLNVITLELPPLRERPSDVIRLAENYLAFFTNQCGKRLRGFSDKARDALMHSRWPGNLRQLRNAIERAVILSSGEWIEPGDFPAPVGNSIDHGTPPRMEPGAAISLKELEEAHIRGVVDRAKTLEEAARILGIDSATLYRKRKRLEAEGAGAA